MTDARDRLRHLAERLPTFLEDLEALVACESPSVDLDANRRCADQVDELALRLLGGRAERVEVDGRVHLRWTHGEPQVLLLGHIDTVWPIGTLERLPFARHDDRLTGPGVFDMKVGVVSALHAAATLDDLDGVTLLLTTDEELGSPTSQELIRATARGHRACLVLEPSADGALKDGRKGASFYELTAHGRAAHAGLEPENGVNALLELAAQLPRVAALGDRVAGTSVTPTVASAGTTSNTVPERARAAIDVRGWEQAELHRVDTAIRALAPLDPSAQLEVRGGINRPPLPRSSGAELLRVARAAAADLGLGELDAVAVGGGSDGNFTAAAGVPTLDGLGAVGGGAHAEHEHALVSAIAPRTALVAELIDRLRTRTL